MIGKSRRSKRRKSNPEKSPVTPSNTNVVSMSANRRRRTTVNQATASPKTAATPTTHIAVPTGKVRRPARTSRRFRLKLPKPILYPLRFIIVGVGIGAFIGTVLAISNSRSYINVTQNVQQQSLKAAQTPSEPVAASTLPLKTPLTAMAESVKQAIAADPELHAALLFVDLDSGEYLDVDSERPVSAASTIKIPVLIAFLQAVDQGKIKLDDTFTLTKELIGDGSGELQYKPIGSTYPALYIATEMSVHSDNTATNMIIDKLGGSAALNALFKQWGMAQTQLNNPLPDLDGTNKTSAKDLAYILGRVGNGEILSDRSRDRLFRIMSRTENDRLLPKSLGENAEIIHKTGDIGVIIGDAGIIDMPNGKRYIGSIFVERPYNSPKGKELLQKIGRQFYDYLDKGTSPKETDQAPVDAASPSEAKPPANGTTPSGDLLNSPTDIAPPSEAAPPSEETTNSPDGAKPSADPATTTVVPPKAGDRPAVD